MKIDLEELLEEYRVITANMTEEKYQYLKEHEFLSPIKIVRLSMLEKNGASVELLARIEYQYLFEKYANHFYKLWKELNWGVRENESLYEFANKALDEQLLVANKQKKKVKKEKVKSINQP